MPRADGAGIIDISGSGSFQNPAWSPDGASILLTRFSGGYNREPADLLVVALDTESIRMLVADGSGNVNLPGSAWNPTTRQIVFSSSRDPHDEVFLIDENGNPGDEIQITARADAMAFEPSFSPDGESVVFESHALDVQGHGVITRYEIGEPGSYRNLTAERDDCRQPNWSPAGDLIVYQKFSEERWDLWLTDPDGKDHRKLTSGSGDKTDASFSPDGRWLVYSSTEAGTEFANLFIIPAEGGASIRATHFEGYDGAPSWSPDGRRIAFESFPGDPDDGPGTALWIIDVPKH